MKPLFIVLSLLLAQAVFADSFEITKDGKDYLCEQKISSNPSAVIDCLSAAQGYQGNYLSKDEAIILCRGARDNAPITCVGVAQGYQGNYLSKAQAMELCQGAKDNSPVTCVSEAQGYQGNYLPKDEAIAICKANAGIKIAGQSYIKEVDVKKTLESFKRQFNLFSR